MWKPIKTCPNKDGDRILLYQYDEGPYVGYWCDTGNRYIPIELYWHRCASEHMFECIHNLDLDYPQCPKCTYPWDDAPSPTHWMPIPEIDDGKTV